MTVVDQVIPAAQEVAERIVMRAESAARNVRIGDRFDITDLGELSCNSQMSTVLRFTTINFARVVKHHSSYEGIHHFEKIR